MHKIIHKAKLAPEVYSLTFEHEEIPRERKPGQFLIIQIDENYGERIPLTIADADPVNNTVRVIFQTIGATTHKLAEKNVGDMLPVVLGPLGQPTHIEALSRVICIAGGVGAAPLLPIAKAFKQAGSELIVIQGSRTAELLILTDEFKQCADKHLVCTDDGSAGTKGFVTDVLKTQIAEKKPDLVVAIGPTIMMKACTAVCTSTEVPVTVSLNTIMIDGTGMCGGCRVSVGGQTKFVCVDGPEFDGALVDFDNLIKRMGTFKTREDADHHKCHLEMEGTNPHA